MANSYIKVGIGGWTFAPWRGVFYPEGLAQKRELEYASRHLSCIEINGTFYGSQKPASFAKWHDETPDGFMFPLKGPRFATYRKNLAEAGESVERFMASGLVELKDKLGPINWQFMPSKTFDATEIEAFLKLLPREWQGRPLRHALEVRHASFANPEFVALMRAHEAAIVVAADAAFPQIADATAPFVYVRLMGTQDDQPKGYDDATLDLWAAHARDWAAGRVPEGLATTGAPPLPANGRDLFLHVISGAKQHNPAAAMALMERLG